jgi:hypothetical protein
MASELRFSGEEWYHRAEIEMEKLAWDLNESNFTPDEMVERIDQALKNASGVTK